MCGRFNVIDDFLDGAVALVEVLFEHAGDDVFEVGLDQRIDVRHGKRFESLDTLQDLRKGFSRERLLLPEKFVGDHSQRKYIALGPHVPAGRLRVGECLFLPWSVSLPPGQLLPFSGEACPPRRPQPPGSPRSATAGFVR